MPVVQEAGISEIEHTHEPIEGTTQDVARQQRRNPSNLIKTTVRGANCKCPS